MIIMDPYENYDNDYFYSFGGYNYIEMDYGAQPYYQFNPYTSSYGNECEYAPSYLDQQLNTSPTAESETPTEQQLLKLAEMIQEFQARELVAIRDLEYKVKQLDEEVERRLQQSMTEVTPEVYYEDGGWES